MTWLRVAALRIREIFAKRRLDAELDEELQAHLEMLAEENMERGMPRQEARRAARIALGGKEQIKEAVRSQRGLPLLESLVADVRFGARMLRKSPGFTAVAVLTLALGIGANTAMFSVVDRVLLNPFPFPEPDRLAILYQSYPTIPTFMISYPNFLDWRRQNHSFEAMAASRGEYFTLTDTGAAEHLTGKMVSAEFFSILGVEPIYGRAFQPEEDEIGGQPVVLLGEAFWRRRFGADADILGSSVTLSGTPHTVVGIVPSFRIFTTNRDEYFLDDVYVPIGQWDADVFRNRGASYGTVAIGRFRPGVTLTQARAEMAQVAANLAAAYPQANEGVGISVVPLMEDTVGGLKPMILLLLGAVGFVLLIVCTNVANLLLARSTGRSREIAIRAALGGSRRRIIRQLLTESVLLSVTGGLAGVALAGWGTSLALQMLPLTLPGTYGSEMNLRVLAFSAVVSVLTGVLFGLAPALKASRPNVQGTLKEGARGATSRFRAQGFLTAMEVALALILLVGAGLMIRSLSGLWSVDPGFDPQNVLTFQTRLSTANQADPDKARAVFQQLEERLAALPGVQYASLHFNALPLEGGSSSMSLWLDGQPRPPAEERRRTLWYAVGKDYFRTMGMPLLRGRAFTTEDDRSAPMVAVVDESIADSFFQGQNPVGKRLQTIAMGRVEIAGVVGHVNYRSLGRDERDEIQAQLYLPYLKAPDYKMSEPARVVIRSTVPPSTLVGAVRSAVQTLDQDQVIYNVRTMDDIVEASLAEQRFSMMLLTTFAGVALLLATVGLYGVVSYLVSRRTREIGIRMAVGAQHSDVLRMVIGGGMKAALIGVAVGIAGALALTQLLSTLLYGVEPTDPLTFVAVTLVLLGVALVACYIPARRATRVEPMVALRHE